MNIHKSRNLQSDCYLQVMFCPTANNTVVHR